IPELLPQQLDCNLPIGRQRHGAAGDGAVILPGLPPIGDSVWGASGNALAVQRPDGVLLAVHFHGEHLEGRRGWIIPPTSDRSQLGSGISSAVALWASSGVDRRW